MSIAIEPKTDSLPPAFRWTVENYARVAETGVFDGRRVELIDGEIMTMSPQGSPHFYAVSRTFRRFVELFPMDEYWALCQAPLSIAPDSAPEPDLAVVPVDHARDRRGYPTTALLVVEVSDSSLEYDRAEKAALYAKAGVPDYWIVNLADRTVEVRRRPETRDDGSFGYAETSVAREGETVSPLARPESVVAVVDLLP